MSFATRFLLLFALLASLLCAPVQASDYEVGTSLVCDTRAQVEHIVAVFDGDAQAAISDVNGTEENPTTCVIRNVAYAGIPSRNGPEWSQRVRDRSDPSGGCQNQKAASSRSARPSISRSSASRNTRFERLAADKSAVVVGIENSLPTRSRAGPLLDARKVRPRGGTLSNEPSPCSSAIPPNVPKPCDSRRHQSLFWSTPLASNECGP